eukprot:g6612.t1
MREKDTLLVGLLTVCAVSTAALVRLIAVCRIFRQQRRRSFTNGSLLDHLQTTDDRVASSRVLVPSLLFHIMVFLCLVVEVPVYAWRWLSASGIASFVEEGRQLYALHMISFLLLYMAFSVVITLWSDVAVFEPNEWTALMNRSMVVLCVCYVLVTCVAVGVCLGLGSVKYFLSSFPFLLFCAYSGAVLLLLGVCFLVVGFFMQRRICRVLVTGRCTARLTARIFRLNVVMLACFVCFNLRALLLADLVEAQAEGEDSGDFAKGWKRWEQDMNVEWALHVIPCVAMLYLMRKAGEPTASSSSTGAGDYDNRSSNERTGFVGSGADEAGQSSVAATKNMNDGAETATNLGNYGSRGSLR